MTNPTVAEYAVNRLVQLGIGHVFGLPGDFSFPFDDAIEANEDLTWILSSNELNAAYSADGYARIHGAAMLTTTYAVGELSALNGVMGSKAERLPVFHLVGSPSVRLVRSRKSIHHSFGDGEFGTVPRSVCGIGVRQRVPHAGEHDLGDGARHLRGDEATAAGLHHRSPGLRAHARDR